MGVTDLRWCNPTVSGTGLLALCVALTCLTACDEAGSRPSAADRGIEDVSESLDSSDPVADGRQHRDKSIRVVTYNAGRFFDPNCDSTDCGGYENVPDESDYQERVRRVATGLEQLEADVLVLQEIETKGVLRHLNNAMTSPFPVVLFGEIGRPASLDVAILSRGSLRRDVDYRGRTLDGEQRSETVFLREFLRADLVIGSETLTVFAAHFKSMANDNPARRRREASRAARIVDHVAEEAVSELYILGGDLNAEIESDAVSTLLTEGKLRWVGRRAEPSERWTYRYGREKLVLDYLLWRAEGSAGYAEGSTRVFRDSDFDGFAGSDHGAVRATFEF